MGLRGPQPQLKLRSEPLTDLEPPEWLGEIAKQYWHKHAKQLKANKLLTVQSSDSFAIHCDVFARLMAFRGLPTCKQYSDTLKAYERGAKFFRLLPTEKPNVKEDRFKDFADYDIDE